MGSLLTLSDMVATHARLQPHKVAVRDSRRTPTWAQWDERTIRLANAMLAGLGLQRGDRVAVLAYNRVEWLEIYAGLARGARRRADQLPPALPRDRLHRRPLRGKGARRAERAARPHRVGRR